MNIAKKGRNLNMRLVYWSGLVIILIAGMGILGCSTLPEVEKTALVEVKKQVPSSHEPELKAWREGMEAFQSGDYPKAMAIFEVLSETAESEAIGQRALYALAVTHLILAQSPKEFSEAVSLWECWSRQNPIDLEGQDPRMITPFLERLTPPGRSETPLPKAQKPPKNTAYNNLYSNYVACKDLLHAREREIESMKSKLNAKEKEVRRLKKQITSLEEIHLKFQEKKQEVSAP